METLLGKYTTNTLRKAIPSSDVASVSRVDNLPLPPAALHSPLLHDAIPVRPRRLVSAPVRAALAVLCATAAAAALARVRHPPPALGSEVPQRQPVEGTVSATASYPLLAEENNNNNDNMRRRAHDGVDDVDNEGLRLD